MRRCLALARSLLSTHPSPPERLQGRRLSPQLLLHRDLERRSFDAREEVGAGCHEALEVDDVLADRGATDGVGVDALEVGFDESEVKDGGRCENVSLEMAAGGIDAPPSPLLTSWSACAGVSSARAPSSNAVPSQASTDA